MKFISKNANYNLVLRPGLPENRVLGSPSVPGLYVRFEHGEAVINEEELIEKLKKHPAYNRDFVSAEEENTGIKSSAIFGGEPDHILTEMKYGTMENSTPSKPMIMSNPDKRKEIEEYISTAAKKMAEEIIKKELPRVVAETIKTMKENEKSVNPEIIESEKEVAKKPGRPSKKIETEITESN